MRYVLISILCLSLFASFGARAEERYSEWGGSDAKYDALVERLNELIDSAEKSRAADPRLKAHREVVHASGLLQDCLGERGLWDQ